MKSRPTTRRLLPLLAALAVLWASCAVLAAPPIRTELVHAPRFGIPVLAAQGEVLVRFRPGTSSQAMNADHARVGARIAQYRVTDPWQRVILPPGTSVDQAVAAYAARPEVEWAQPNFLRQGLVTPNDPMLNQQTFVDQISLKQAWDVTKGSASAPVAIVDSGVDYTHPDLSSKLWTNPGEVPNNGVDDDGNGFVDDVHGWNFVDQNNNPINAVPQEDHGTHVAGLAAAATDNGVGGVGVAWNCPLMLVRVMQYSAAAGGVVGYDSDIAAGIRYAADNGAKVINLSLGGPGDSTVLADAITYAYGKGSVIVAAAGNSDLDISNGGFAPVTSETSANEVVGVAAVDANDDKASFSNFGTQHVDIAAPGVSIFSTLPGNSYGALSGTSMSTPIVSGVAALLLSKEPGLSQAQVLTRLQHWADPIYYRPTNQPFTGKLGAGRVDAAAAVLGSTGLLSITPTVTAPSFAFPGDTVNLMTLHLSAQTSTVVVGGLTFNNQPGANSDAEASVTLIDDVNGNGKADVGEPVVGQGTYASGAVTIQMDYAVTPGTDRQLLVEAAFSAQAVPGHSFAARLAAPASVQVQQGQLSAATQALFPIPVSNDPPVTVTDPAQATLLLVDDDLGAAFETFYTSALTTAGFTFQRWDVNRSGPLPATVLTRYRGLGKAAVWFTGNDSQQTLTATDQANLSAFLDGGGRVLLSGQDIGWNLTNGGTAPNTFLSNYAHVNVVQDDSGLARIVPAPGDCVAGTANLLIDGGTGAGNQRYPSEIAAIAPATALFTYDPTGPTLVAANYVAPPGQTKNSTPGPLSSKGAAVRYDSGTYKVAYFAFGIEGISDESARASLLQRVVDWLWAGSDTVAPTIQTFTAEDHPGATDRLIIQYSKPMNQTSVANLANYSATQNGTAVDFGAAGIQFDGNATVTITNLQLDPTQNVAVTVHNVADASCNVASTLTADAAVTDKVPPTVTSAVVNNRMAALAFSEPVLKSEAETAASYQLQSPSGTTVDLSTKTFAYDVTTHSLTITGLSLPNADYVLKVTGAIHDMAGNALVVPVQFTGNVTDVVAPTVVSTAVNNVQFAVTFSEAVQQTDAQTAASYHLESPAGTAVDLSGATFAYDNTSHVLTVSGLSLKTGVTYVLSINGQVRDLAGNSMAVPVQFTGTVAGVNPPTVASATATNNAVTIQFSKPVRPDDAGTISNYLLSSPIGTPIDLTGMTRISESEATPNGATVTITGVSLLTGKTFRVAVSNVRDLNDNPVAAPSTADGTVTGVNPPTIKSVSARPDRVIIQFSKPLQPATVTPIADYKLEILNSDSERVRDQQATTVDLTGAAVQYDSATSTATITGLALGARQTFRLTVTGVLDLNDNPLADPQTVTGTVSLVLSIPGGTTTAGATKIGMISVPLAGIPPLADITTLFGSGTRIAVFAPDKYVAGDADPYVLSPPNPLTVVPGQGVWATHDGGSVDAALDAGTLPTGTQRIPIAQPVQLVGNPFAKELPWDLDALQFSVNGSAPRPLRDLLTMANPPLAPYGWTWDPDSGQYVFVFDPKLLQLPAGLPMRATVPAGGALFLFATVPGVELVVPEPAAVKSNASRMLSAQQNWSRAALTDSWSCGIAAADGSTADRGGLFGVAGQSRSLAIPEPPRAVGQTTGLRVTFADPDSSSRMAVPLKMDLKSAGARLQWDMMVDGAAPGSTVVLTWPDLTRVPHNLRLVLTDLDSGRRVAMRTQSSYTYRSAPTGPAWHRFRLEAVPVQQGGIRIGQMMVTAAGRSRGAGAVVSFTLSRDATATLEVRSVAGMLVRTVGPATMSAGLNQFVWDGTTAAGVRAAAGIYILDVTAVTDEGEAFRTVRTVRLQ